MNIVLYLILSIIPFVNIYIAYKINKLKRFLLLFVFLFVGLNFVSGLFLDPPYNIIIFLAIYVPVVIYYMYKWLGERNKFKNYESRYIQ